MVPFGQRSSVHPCGCTDPLQGFATGSIWAAVFPDSAAQRANLPRLTLRWKWPFRWFECPSDTILPPSDQASLTAPYATGCGCSTFDSIHPYLVKCVEDAQHNQCTFDYDGAREHAEPERSTRSGGWPPSPTGAPTRPAPPMTRRTGSPGCCWPARPAATKRPGRVWVTATTATGTSLPCPT